VHAFNKTEMLLIFTGDLGAPYGSLIPCMLLASVHHTFVNALEVTKIQNSSFHGSNRNVNTSVVDGFVDSVSSCPKIFYRKVTLVSWGDWTCLGKIG